MKPIPKRKLIPVITDLLEYKQAALDTIAYSGKMVAKYGDVCDVSFTGIKSYFIHDPEVIREILTTQSPKFKRTYLFRAFRKFLGDGLFTSDGDYHRRQRRLIKPAFLPQRIEGYADVMVQCAVAEISGWKDGETIDINEAMTRITLQVITKTLFGADLDPKIIEVVSEKMPVAFELMNDIVQNPFYVFCLLRGIKVPLIKRFYKTKAILDGIINDIIASYRRDDDAGKADLLTMLMHAREEETGQQMTDEQVRDEVMTFFIAGHETTKLALTWTWYLLGKHPGIAESFYKEVKEKIGGRLPVASDYQALQLTKNIFRESLRLYPPAWTFAREATEDVVIRDYHFPKGAVLWTVTYLIHHNERYFHQASEFIPSRWEEEKMKELPRYAYFPFGGGNRMCIGEGFAWMEGILVLATIASRFKLELPTGFSTEVAPLFSLKTKDHIPMTVRALN